MQDLVAAKGIWNRSEESLESIEHRIHDSVPLGKLGDRADGYVKNIFESFGALSLPRAPEILEIGSGVGYIMEAVWRYLDAQGVKDAHVSGLDIAEHMIEKAKARLERLPHKNAFSFSHYDGLSVPARDNSCDLVYSVATLQHIPKLYVYNLFFEVKRILKTTGYAVLHFLSFKHLAEQEKMLTWQQELRRQIDRTEGHWHHFYATEELNSVLSVGTGFSSVSLKEMGTTIWCCVRK